jgi:DNA-binding NarL/FixJ family response regulator
MIEAGAVGYLTKQYAADELVNAIRQAMSGGTYFSRKVAAAVQRVGNGGPKEGSRGKDLNDREKDIVKLIVRGLTTKEISLRLELDLAQTRYRRERIMNKLGLRSVAELTRFAVAQGWVPVSPETPERCLGALSVMDSRTCAAA